MKYRTIYADPPWPIKWAHSAGIRTRHLDYQTMPIAEICALDVKSIAEDDCNLFLWTTNQFLPEALWVVRHWGFNYEMLFTWCKNNGMGSHPRNATEHMVIATRGTLSRGSRNDPMILNWLNHPIGAHSEKPQPIIDIIEKISPAPRLEMFARQYRLGWDVWGNQVESHVQLRHLTQPEPDAWESAPLNLLSTLEADSDLGNVPTPTKRR